MMLKETVHGNVKFLVLINIEWRAVVNTVMNLYVSIKKL